MSTIETSVNGQTATIRINAPIDGEMAECLKTAFSELPLEKIRQLILDFSGVSFIGSAGLGKLLIMYKRISSNGGTIEIHGASPDIQELLRELRLDLLVKIV